MAWLPLWGDVTWCLKTGTQKRTKTDEWPGAAYIQRNERGGHAGETVGNSASAAQLRLIGDRLTWHGVTGGAAGGAAAKNCRAWKRAVRNLKDYKERQCCLRILHTFWHAHRAGADRGRGGSRRFTAATRHKKDAKRQEQRTIQLVVGARRAASCPALRRSPVCRGHSTGDKGCDKGTLHALCCTGAQQGAMPCQGTPHINSPALQLA